MFLYLTNGDILGIIQEKGFDKKEIVWYGVWELGWFELRHYGPSYKEVPYSISLHFTP
jgi:hypothetical protein